MKGKIKINIYTRLFKFIVVVVLFIGLVFSNAPVVHADNSDQTAPYIFYVSIDSSYCYRPGSIVLSFDAYDDASIKEISVTLGAFLEDGSLDTINGSKDDIGIDDGVCQ